MEQKKTVRHGTAFLTKLLLTGTVLFCAAELLFPPGACADDLVKQTAYGAVQGKNDEFNSLAWLGIPYAKPPVGDLRWKEPQTPDPWTGTRDATAFEGTCIQYNAGHQNPGEIGSEDCLYLNIWRPTSTEANLPVYVFLHGGNNSIGSSTDDDPSRAFTNHGSSLAAKAGMVVVTLNFRLGLFGWLTHPALRVNDGSAGDSGNFALLDIMQALGWIKQNIAAFGGDPGNVTLSGELASGSNVLALMLSDTAKGLFHKAVVMSPGYGTDTVADGESYAATLLCNLIVNDGLASDLASAQTYLAGMSNQQVAGYLRGKTTTQLFAGLTIQDGVPPDTPALFEDGAVIPAGGYDNFKTGGYGKMPIMLGTDADDFKLYAQVSPYFVNNTIWAYFAPWLLPVTFSIPKRIAYETVAAYGSALWTAWVDGLARDMAGNQDSVFAYNFMWKNMPQPYRFLWGSTCYSQLPFFFGDFDGYQLFGKMIFKQRTYEGRSRLSDAIIAYEKQFSLTGDPNEDGSGLPQWLPWSNDDGAPKRIQLDATGSQYSIAMADTERDASAIMADMKKKFPARTLSFMENIYNTGWGWWPGL